MSTPPPGGWPPGPPPNPGQPNGRQDFNLQQPAGWQQGPWPQQPGSPPPQKGNSLKWLLIAVAVLLVIGISIGATLIFTRADGGGGGGGGTTARSAAASDFASAGDTGPIQVISAEPTCTAFTNISNELARVQANGWSAGRADLGPAPSWSAEQRTEVQAVTTALRNGTDQVEPLATQTPHRLIRELYQQFISYSRAYVNAVENYTPINDGLATASVNAANAVLAICNTITYGSSARSLTLDPPAPPSAAPPPLAAANATLLFQNSDPLCKAWLERSDALKVATSEWGRTDANVPGSQWSPERRALEQAVQPALETYARETEAAGRKSDNPVVEDLSVASALYLRAYLTVGDTYTSADGWLTDAAFRMTNLVDGACRAAGG